MGGGNYNLEYLNEGYAPIQRTISVCNSSDCYGACYTHCGGCDNTCRNGCRDSCKGCDGCSGCGSGCANGCSNTCKNACTNLCTGSGSKISINGSIKTARFYTSISNTVKQSSTQYIGINGVIKQI